MRAWRPSFRWPVSFAGRVAQLLIGLTVAATGIWMTIQSHLGVASWEVLHIGLARHLGVGIGTASVCVGAVLVAVVALLGVRPGIGTLLNVVMIGVVLNVLLAAALLDDLQEVHPAWRLLVLLLGIAVFSVGCATYVGAHLGPGPRDGLMVGLHLRFGVGIATARVISEGTGLGAGWLLGGPVGIGTVLFVLGAGPAIAAAFTVLRLRPVREPVRHAL
jgi:uncharacterized membrane protein YczE